MEELIDKTLHLLLCSRRPKIIFYYLCRFSSCSDPLFLKFTFKLDPDLVTSKSRYLYLKLTHPEFTPRIDPLPYNVFTSYPCSLR